MDNGDTLETFATQDTRGMQKKTTTRKPKTKQKTEKTKKIGNNTPPPQKKIK